MIVSIIIMSCSGINELNGGHSTHMASQESRSFIIIMLTYQPMGALDLTCGPVIVAHIVTMTRQPDVSIGRDASCTIDDQPLHHFDLSHTLFGGYQTG